MAQSLSAPINPTTTATITTIAGSFSGIGTIYLFPQARNRSGYNLLPATGTEISYTTGQGISIEFPAIAAGEDVWEFSVSGSLTNDPTTAVILASIRTRGDATVGVVTYPGKGALLSAPFTIELTEDSHIALSQFAANTAALPTNPLYGMVRYLQDAGQYWKYDDRATSGLFASGGGYWVSHPTGFSQYVADEGQGAIASTQVQGWARPLNQISVGAEQDSVIEVAPYLFDGVLQTANYSPQFAIANRTGNSPIEGGTRIEVRWYVNGGNISAVMAGLAVATLIGKVTLSDGTLDTTADGVGTPVVLGPSLSGVGGIVTPEDLSTGEAWVYRLQLQADQTTINTPDSPIANGDILTYYPKVEGALGERAPYAPLLGQGVATTGDRCRVLPSNGTAKATMGSGSLLSLDESTFQGHIAFSSVARDIIGILASTDDQAIAVNTAFNSILVRSSSGDLESYEELRAIVGTGLGPASGYYSASDWSSPVAIAGNTEAIALTVTFPTTIRSDYPDDQIQGQAAPLNASEIAVLVRYSGTIYAVADVSLGASPQQISITDIGAATLGSAYDSSSDPAFGLFDYSTIAAVATAEGSSLAAGSYEVAIAWKYSGSEVTRISHSEADGCIRLLPQLSGLAYLSEAQTFTKAQRSLPVALTISSGVVVIDCNDSNTFTLLLTENITAINLANLSAGTNFDLEITQDETGGRTVTGWDSAIAWMGDAPTITTDANGVEVLMFKSFDGTTLRGAIAP